MKQQQFEAEHAPLWERIAAILDGAGQREALPELYRQLCQCLALASQRGYAPALTDYLQKMVGDCHKRLYGASAARPALLLRWLAWDLPRRVRAEWRLLLLACLAFYGVALVVGLMIWFDPHWAYSFSDASQLDSYRKMYQSGALKSGRGSEGDVLMFGHYIWNNVSICFRTFAGGIVGGIPALFSIAFNGMHFGVIGAWLTKDPATRNNFWSFVITHSAFEVTGLLLSSMAGMRMGLTLIHPGRRTRAHALQDASRDMFPVIVGGALLTFGAAFIEGFWSASAAIPSGVKYAVGGVCWALVIAFFVFAGRRRQ